MDGTQPRKSPNGTAILIMGVIGLFMCPFSLIAWIWGHSEEKEYPDDSNVRAGKLMGMILTIVNLVGTLAFGAIFAGYFFFVATVPDQPPSTSPPTIEENLNGDSPIEPENI